LEEFVCGAVGSLGSSVLREECFSPKDGGSFYGKFPENVGNRGIGKNYN